ncbi:hypothetical protein HG531_012541 [Fusarium graminearum]|nr:hypothetical protein HG531_012541 [Fusarium graminearum]
MLVFGRVEKNTRGTKKCSFERVGDREEEEDGDGCGRGQSGDESLGGEVLETVGGGEGFQFGMVLDVFRNSRIISAYELITLALSFRNSSESLDRKSNILLPLKTVDAQDDLLALERNVPIITSIFLFLDPSVDTRIHHFGVGALLEIGPRLVHNTLCETRVYCHSAREAHSPFFKPIERATIQALQGRFATLRKKKVGEMAVEEDWAVGGDVAHERKAGGELVDDKSARV